MKRWSLGLVVLAALSLAEGVLHAGEVSAEVEGGAVWFTRNDIRIPGDSGTRFDMLDLTGTGPSAYGRIYVNYAFKGCHLLRLNIAPLRVTGTGVPAQDISFNGSQFEAGSPIAATYKFNNYRLAYRWRCYSVPRWTVGIGAALLVRDAEIALKQGDISESNTDLGVVPLLHVSAEYLLSQNATIEFDAVGAFAPQGRAVDASLKLRYEWPSEWRAAIGYRTLEGGADNDSVYTFAWLHYGLVSISRDF